MSTPAKYIPFRDVIPRLGAAIQPLLRRGLELTIVRDVFGKVRLVVEGRPEPTNQERIDLERTLRAAVGDWMGLQTPVWTFPKQPKKPEKILDSLQPLYDQITQQRLELKDFTGVFLVERHVSRGAWTGTSTYEPPWSRNEAVGGEKTTIITFFSHKGGVGRTTAMVATALNLARAGKRLLLVDLDLEAPGLGSIFGGSAGPEGLLDLLMLDQIEGPDLERMVIQVNDDALIKEGEPIRVLPAGEVDIAYMEMLARLDLGTSGSRPRMVGRLKGLFDRIQSQWSNLDYIFVDARAGFHDLGGVMLASLTHGAVMVATPNPQSNLGVQMVARLLGEPARKRGQEPVPLLLVHGMAPPLGKEGRSRELKLLQEQLYDILRMEYYPSSNIPGLEDNTQPHATVPLSWNESLRGLGGALAPDIAELLTGPDYIRLSTRLQTLFPGRQP
ncbi:MAG TPA: P-loop NTPase [Myxococcota bacterium]|nr:P-loop NTPase [Myxococcota bacterium]HNH45616.1 P-loop NTPase [Myxococcota bacterium]